MLRYSQECPARGHAEEDPGFSRSARRPSDLIQAEYGCLQKSRNAATKWFKQAVPRPF